MRRKIGTRILMLLGLVLSLTMVSTRLQAQTGSCAGASLTLPFSDVSGSSVFFCAIAEAFITGLTNGTTATTYSPGANVTRDQMAAFITRTLDKSLERGSRRAALGQWWTLQDLDGLNRSGPALLGDPFLIASDGTDLWVTNPGSNHVIRVRASDGKILESWPGATGAYGVVVAGGRIFVTGIGTPGLIYFIDPKQPPGPVSPFISTGPDPHGITFDGRHLWTANLGSISRAHPASRQVTTFTTGFARPEGILFDGSSLWVTDTGDDTLKKVNLDGVITQTIAVGTDPQFPVFDGTNLWVPNRGSDSVTIVRAATGQVLATLTGNGLDEPISAAFDGERILVTNFGGRVSLWKASDLTPLGSILTGGRPTGACSDGLNFWVNLRQPSTRLIRF